MSRIVVFIRCIFRKLEISAMFLFSTTFGKRLIITSVSSLKVSVSKLFIFLKRFNEKAEKMCDYGRKTRKYIYYTPFTSFNENHEVIWPL